MLSFNKYAARQELKFNIEGPNVKYMISIKKNQKKNKFKHSSTNK